MLDARKLQETILKLEPQNLDQFKRFDCHSDNGQIVLTIREPRVREFIAFLKMNTQVNDPLISYLSIIEELTVSYFENDEQENSINVHQLAYLPPEVVGGAIQIINRFFLTLAQAAGIKLDLDSLGIDTGTDNDLRGNERKITTSTGTDGSAIFLDPAEGMGSRTARSNATDRTIDPEVSVPDERQKFQQSRKLRSSAVK